MSSTCSTGKEDKPTELKDELSKLPTDVLLAALQEREAHNQNNSDFLSSPQFLDSERVNTNLSIQLMQSTVSEQYSGPLPPPQLLQARMYKREL